MSHEPTRWLLVSAGLEILVSSLLGYVMLIPMQPWGKVLRDRLPAPRAVMSIHLDMVMLALMQAAAALGIYVIPSQHDRLAAVLLVASGWLNVTPYVWRAFGVNAFALTGGAVQRLAASISLASTLALTTAWVLLVAGWA